MLPTKLLVIILYCLCHPALAGTVYKYKDDNGNWVFSDRKPIQNVEIESLQYQHQQKRTNKPKLHVRKTDSHYELMATNPFYAPIEISLASKENKTDRYKKVIPALSSTVVLQSDKKIPRFQYRWIFGDPKARHDNFHYQIPITSPKKYKITQSFNGRFSHFRTPSIYAVDIAMPIGTNISAARAGTVIGVKDDYHMSGTTQYFLDKANYITVLHQDGSYAMYAHILQSTALVAPGDKVKAGDKLARSGSSGFSTGPHLHFVIRRNVGFKTKSVKFVFANNKGRAFTPKAGMMVGK